MISFLCQCMLLECCRQGNRNFHHTVTEVENLRNDVIKVKMLENLALQWWLVAHSSFFPSPISVPSPPVQSQLAVNVLLLQLKHSTFPLRRPAYS